MSTQDNAKREASSPRRYTPGQQLHSAAEICSALSVGECIAFAGTPGYVRLNDAGALVNEGGAAVSFIVINGEATIYTPPKPQVTWHAVVEQDGYPVSFDSRDLDDLLHRKILSLRKTEKTMRSDGTVELKTTVVETLPSTERREAAPAAEASGGSCFSPRASPAGVLPADPAPPKRTQGDNVKKFRVVAEHYDGGINSWDFDTREEAEKWASGFQVCVATVHEVEPPKRRVKSERWFAVLPPNSSLPGELVWSGPYWMECNCKDDNPNALTYVHAECEVELFDDNLGD